MAFPIHASTTPSTVTTLTTSHSVALGTTAAGDHLFMVFSFHTNVLDSTVNTPAGWDLIGTVYRTPSNGRMGFFHRHADGTEGSTVTVTTSGNAQSVSHVLRVTGGFDSALQGTAWDASVLVGDFDITPDPAAATASWGSADNLFLVLLGYGASNDPITAFPTDYNTLQTETQNDTGAQDCSAGSCSRQLAAASDNPGAFTLAGSENGGCVTIAVRPASGVTVTPVRAEATTVARAPSIRNEIIVTPVRAEAHTQARAATVPRRVLPAFPVGTLGARIELAFGAVDSTPLQWVWTDVSNRMLDESTMSIRRGRADEASQPQPSAVSGILDNGDGALTPGNAGSPFWPHVRRHTPMRVTVPGDTPALILPGLEGAYASTPNHLDFNFAGPIDVRVRLEPEQWSTGMAFDVNGGRRPQDRPQPLLSRWTDPDDLAWMVSINGPGFPYFNWTTDGTDLTQMLISPDSVFAAQGPVWLGMTFDPDNGSGQTVQRIYRHHGEVPPIDITTWELVAEWTFVGTTTVHYGSSDLRIGAPFGDLATSPGEDKFRGRILAVELRDGINGTVVADPDFTTVDPGTRVLVDSTAKTWTVFGAAEISTRRIRVVGQVDEIDPYWPHGDNEPSNPSGVRPSESRVAITASGVLRRLAQGAKPLRSTLYRHATSAEYRGAVTAYWPLEDDSGAVNYGSAVDGQPPLLADGLDAGSDNSLPASAALPSIPAGQTGSWSAPVPPSPFDFSWAVDWVFRIPTPATAPTEMAMMTVLTGGTARRWEFALTATSAILRVTAPDGTQLLNSVTGIGPDVYGGWVLARLRADRVGSNIDWAWQLVVLDAGTAPQASGSFAGTMGRVSGVENTITGPPDGMSIGHIIVSRFTSNTWLAGADTAWVGESAAHRFWRLCAEEGIPAEIIGDPRVAAFTPLRGDLDRSEPMGPQEQRTFLELLDQCAQVDLGVYSRTTARPPGSCSAPEQTLENQAPALALDAAANAPRRHRRPLRTGPRRSTAP